MSSIKKDTIVFGVTQIAERVVSFLLITVLAKSVSQDEFAIWSQSVVVSGFATPVLLLGFQTALIKYMHRFEDEPAKWHSLLFAMLTGIAFTMVALVLTMTLFPAGYSWLIFGNPKYVVYIQPLVAMIVSESLMEFMVGLLRAGGKIRKISYYLFVKSLFRMGVFCAAVYLNSFSFYWAFLSFTIVQLGFVGYLYLRYLPFGKMFVTGLSAARDMWREVLTYALPLVPLALVTALNSFAGRFFLANMHGLEEVAGYSASFSIAALIASVYSILGFTVFPELSRRYAGGDMDAVRDLVGQAVVVYLFLLIPFIFGLALVGPDILLLMTTANYNVPWYILMMQGVSVGLFGGYQILFYVTLLGRGSMNGLYVMSFSAVMNLLFDIVLIPKYSSLGVVVATCLSNALLLILTLFIARKIIPMRVQWSYSLRIVLRSVIMLLLLWGGLALFGNGNRYVLVISVAAAAVLYFIMDLLDSGYSIIKLLKRQ